MVPRPIRNVGPPPAAKQEGLASPLAETCGDRYEWAHAMGGADLFTSTAEVTLTGGPESTVTVTGQVHVISRKSAFDGSILSCSGRGSGLTPLALCVDLTLQRLRFCPHGFRQKKPFVRQLASGEAEVLKLVASANPPIAEAEGPNGVYEWTVDLDVNVNGNEHHYVVDDNGKPFRTYATKPLARVERDSYMWVDGSWQHPPSP